MDKFIEEHIIQSKFDSLSPEACQAHKAAMVKALMDCVVGTTIMFVSMSELPKVEPVVKKKTRPINPLRHNADGTYNSHCLAPDYSHNSYNEKLKGIVSKCPCCGSEVLKTN